MSRRSLAAARRRLALKPGLLAAAGLACFLAGCDKKHEGHEGHDHDEPPAGAESRVRRAADGSVSLTLDAETQKRIALQTAPLAPATLPREVKAFGRVLDPAPLGLLVMELGAAQTARDASARELQRVKTLAEGQNASARAVEAAETAVRRDDIALEAVRLKLATGWGRALADQADLPGLARSLAAMESALVRLDLPAGETAATPRGARLLGLAHSGPLITAEYLGPAINVEPQTQGRGFLFLVKSGDHGFRPGEALIGFIQQPGEPFRGVLVPASAIIRAAGKAWIYLQTGDTTFVRRDIALDHPAEGGWLVTAGLSASDRVVVTGAQVLFSEEQKGRLKAEH